MILTKELDNYLKKTVDGYARAYSITENGDNYRVEYIKTTQYNKNPVHFSYASAYLNLKQFKRDFVISETLDSLLNMSDFDVEEIIYTPEQRESKERKLKNFVKKIKM